MEFMLSSKLFWGAIVVLAGLVIIANAVFNINIPIFRVFFALLLIYWGVKMLLDIRPRQSGNDAAVAVFSESNYEGKSLDKREFSAVFGSQTVDLRHIEFPSDAKIEVNAVFGSSTLLLPPEVTVQVEQNAVFGSVDDKRRNPINDGNKVLRLEANAVFGSIDIIQ